MDDATRDEIARQMADAETRMMAQVNERLNGVFSTIAFETFRDSVLASFTAHSRETTASMNAALTGFRVRLEKIEGQLPTSPVVANLAIALAVCRVTWTSEAAMIPMLYTAGVALVAGGIGGAVGFGIGQRHALARIVATVFAVTEHMETEAARGNMVAAVRLEGVRAVRDTVLAWQRRGYP